MMRAKDDYFEEIPDFPASSLELIIFFFFFGRSIFFYIQAGYLILYLCSTPAFEVTYSLYYFGYAKLS
jgi:hypothetical protein